MGNTNCNNAVPCLGSEMQDSPKGRIRKQGVMSKQNRRNSQGNANSVNRSIDTFISEQREQGHSMSTMRSDKLLSQSGYGGAQMIDETGMPHHYLLETVGDSSGNSSGTDSGPTSHQNPLYASQRTSLFEEFVDQTLTNFSCSEFDKSISLVEFTIQSQIFTRAYQPEKKKGRFSISKSKSASELPSDPVVVFTLAIGDVYMCKWSGEEACWDSKTNDMNVFPYHQDTLAAAELAQQASQKKKSSSKSKEGASTLPDVVRKRLCIPFEFRFTNQDVTLEIRDTSDNCLLYEVQVPFEQLLSEPQLLQEPDIILASSDSRHMVRMSVRELEESQKMLMKLKIQEVKGQDNETQGSLLIGSDDKIELWSAKTEVYEVFQSSQNGQSYRKRIIHHNDGFEEIKGEMEIQLTILVPHYESGFFQTRQFQIEFDQKKIIQLSGKELTSLASQGQMKRTLRDIPRPASRNNSLAMSEQQIVDDSFRLQIPKSSVALPETVSIKSDLMPYPDITIDSGNISNQGSIIGDAPPRNEPAASEHNFAPLNGQTIRICAPVQIERPLSIVSLIQTGDLRVVPLIGIDFSLGNLTFEDNTVLHSTNPQKPNDYRNLLRMLSHAYRNVLNLPIFGYGSKTSTFSSKTCHLFPVSRSIRNPFTPNDENSIDQTYSDCFSTLELSVPVNLTPLVTFFKKLGQHQEKRLKRKASQNSKIKDTFDTFYVLYILSTGIIDDVQELISELRSKEWRRMPLQIHLISLAPNHLQESDQDTQSLCEEVNKLNKEAGWPQFQIHFYDRIKRKMKARNQKALLRLKQDCVLRVPRDIESCIFANGYNLAKYRHNQNLTNATQSQQYIMDLIDQKFEKLKDSVYKLGISPVQFRNMVEGQALYEWSPEVALALSTRFCSWVVAETDAEHNDDVTDEARSLLKVRQRSRIDSLLASQIDKQRGDSSNARRPSSGNNQNSGEDQIKTNPSNEQDYEPEPIQVKQMLLHEVSEEASSPRFASTPALSELPIAEEEKKESNSQSAATANEPEQLTQCRRDSKLDKGQPQVLRSRSGEEGENPEVIVPVQSPEEEDH